MRESTKRLVKKHGWRVDVMLHNYLYFIFYYPYVWFVYHVFRLLSKYLYWVRPLRMVLSAAFNRYHSKVLSFDNAKKIFELNEDVVAVSSKNKRIIPFKYAYKILFLEPDYIALMDCPCKKTLHAPEWTINSCIAVGKGTAAFWIDKCGKKYHAHKITQTEALDLVKKFRKAGFLTQGFFKVATGGSTGVICNCHIDSCVALQATRFAKRFSQKFSMQIESGYSVSHDQQKCETCGTCSNICQFGAISLSDGIWTYSRKVCMGCELCKEHCPQGAISLYADDQKAVPLDIEIVKKEYAGL